MRRVPLAVLAIGVAGLLADSAGAQPKGGRFGPNAFGSGWLPSLEMGMTQARKTGKPLMVVIRCVP
jgi:hypothetical protein